MLKGILIVNDVGKLKYAYTNQSINPLILSGVVYATQAVISGTLNQPVRRILLDKLQILVRFIPDMNLVVLADKEDNTALIENFLEELSRLLNVKIERGIDEKLEAKILAIMTKYRKLLCCDRLASFLKERPFWLDEKALSKIIITIILNGDVKIIGYSEKRPVIKSIINETRLMLLDNILPSKSEYNCTIDCTKGKISSDIPEELNVPLGEILIKGEHVRFLKMIETIFLVARKIASLKSKVPMNPSQFVELLLGQIGQLDKELSVMEDKILLLALELARRNFYISEKEYATMYDTIVSGLFLTAFTP